MLLQDKRLLITGVLTDGSIAWHAARIAQEQGAEIVVTGFGRGMRLTERSVQRLPRPCDVIELDINDPSHVEALVADLDARFELYGYLRKLLGDRDAYWMEFDAAHDKQCMSGSLADDLTDIYCELKAGLVHLERYDDARHTLGHWRSGFCKHWGQHVVDAERHLYALSARDRLC